MSAAENKAVFLSYASQDAEAARRICEALRAAGVEVWFDQSELRGGDAWDQKIRRQIKECALFVPIISANTQARAEGYFRREWKLAVERTHDMADHVAFLVPVVIDSTSDAAAFVPEKYREVQWTRLTGGEAQTAFCDRVKTLLGGVEVARAFQPVGSADTGWKARVTPEAALRRDRAAQPPLDFAPAKSIAVLAFANLSHDPENEYFSDGISEELLNVLAKVPGLRVTARTSSFYFKGRNLPVPEIAQKLGVSYVVEGSVRRAGCRVRITAQLIDAVEDAHLWSETFDRELKDIFAVQDEIAGLIAQNLQLTLGAARRPATQVDPEAYRLCLEGRRGLQFMSKESVDRAEALFQEALEIAPDFAPASVGLAHAANIRILITGATAKFRREELIQGEQRARDALRLDPQNGDAHTVMALVALIWGRLADAGAEYQRAVELGASSDSLVSSIYPVYWLRMGRPDRGAVEMERVCRLDPFSWLPSDLHGVSLLHGGRPAEAISWFERAEQLGSAPITFAHHAIALGKLGRNDEAIRKARQALDRATNPLWGNSFNALSESYAAWGLAAVGARDEAREVAERLWRGLEHNRWNAGIPLLLLGKIDEALQVLPDSWERCWGFFFGFLHDYEHLQSDPRIIRLLRDVGAEQGFETLKRVRRGEKLE